MLDQLQINVLNALARGDRMWRIVVDYGLNKHKYEALMQSLYTYLDVEHERYDKGSLIRLLIEADRRGHLGVEESFIRPRINESTTPIALFPELGNSRNNIRKE